MRVVAMLCRTSDRAANGAAAAKALAEEIAARADVEPRLIGTPAEPREASWDQDLSDGRGCLLEAGGQVSDALRSGWTPVLVAADCSVAMTTLREVARERPGTMMLWFDARADFHSPQSTESAYLGGMCLAAACGVWEPGLGSADPVAPQDVLLSGVRETDPGELPLLDINNVTRAGGGAELLDRITGRRVFVHLDLDVIDPDDLPGGKSPVPGGPGVESFYEMLECVAGDAAEIVGLEITGLGSVEHVELVANLVAPLIGLD